MQRLIKLIMGIIMAVGVFLGLWIIQNGLEALLISDGTDIVYPQDLGELTVEQTRYVDVQFEALLQVLAGIVLVAASVLGVNRLQQVLVRSAPQLE